MVTKGKQSGSSTQEARDLLEADIKAFLESGKKLRRFPKALAVLIAPREKKILRWDRPKRASIL